jgi:inhibitor of KinA sporulation pathway (predicted exonuclease)|tara:strand:- start:2924 stop:3238 length:315 start_codon:yes stop_codon:yes gene_type:complete
MATTTIEQSEITLIDGSKVSVRPLKVSLLRSFLKKFAEIADVATDNDKSMNILMECVQIAMRQYKPEIADDLEALEELLDLPTVYKVVEAASGIVLDDANVLGT